MHINVYQLKISAIDCFNCCNSVYLRNVKIVKSAWLVLFLTFSFANLLNAQVSTYSFSEAEETYAPISGGAVFNSTPTRIDDQVYNDLPIGFTFNFNSVDYTSFSISANGFIALGTSVSSSVAPLSTGVTNNVISAAGMNIRAINTSTASNIRYETLGSAPNRTLAVQWTAFAHFDNNTAHNLNFQIRLNENSNAIQIVYGTFATTSTLERNPQIGLRGASNADFNNRSLATTTAWLNNTTLGTANTNTVRFRSSAIPVSGLTFTWTPPTPCSGTPNTPNVTISSTQCCPSKSIQLKSSGFSIEPGISYQWQSSSDNSNWMDITGATSTSYTYTSVLGLVYFRLVTLCSNSNESSISNAVSFTGMTCINMPAGTNSITTCSALFYDSGGPAANYGNNENRTYTFFPATAGSKIVLDFTQFVTESSSGCADQDILRIYDGNNTSAPLISTSQTGCASRPAPGLVTSTATDGSLTVHWKSDGSVNAAGWLAEVSCTAPLACTGTPDTPIASIALSSGCSGLTVVLSATNFTSAGGITYQWQTSTDQSNWSDITGATNISHNLTTEAGLNYYRLVTHCSFSNETSFSNSVSYDGVTCINMPAGNNSITTCSGFFYDSGGPGGSFTTNSAGNYGNNEDRVFTFFPTSSTNKIQLDFTAFTTETCCDFLQLFDGSSTSAPLIGTYQGTNSPGTVTSSASNGAITARFFSDGSQNRNGWEATISCIPPPAYLAEFISVDYGLNTWCPGEERTVSVTLRNAGLATWNTDYTTNIGLKWNTNGSSWDDYYLMINAGQLAPGDTMTYQFTIQASNATAGPVYGSALDLGSNNLTFDVVNVGDCWFSGNNNSCGPGNSVFTSPNIQIAPGINEVTGANFCQSSVTLHAESCAGGTILWYQNEDDCEPIGVGSSFTTPWLTSTTSYYAAVASDSITEGSIASSLANNNFHGLAGEMFEVGATGGKNIEIKAIKVRHYNSNMDATMRVYFRPDPLPSNPTYPVGLVNNNWTQVYQGTHSGASNSLSDWITLTDKIIIPAGCTYSIYIFYPVFYRGNPTAADNIVNDDLTIYAMGLGAAASSTEFDMMAAGARGFRGELLYDAQPVSDKVEVVATANMTMPQVPSVFADEAGVCETGAAVLNANGLAPGGKVAEFVPPSPTISGTNHTSITNSFTVEFWAKPNRTRTTTAEANSGLSGSLANEQSFATAPINGGASNAGMGVSVGTNGISVFEHGAGYFPSLLVRDMPIDDWVHVAVVYDNKTPSLYVNGNFVRTGLTSTRDAIFPSSTISSPDGYGYYHGLLDNLRIWDFALSQTQIQENMFLETSTINTGLVEHIDFNNQSTDADYYTYTWSTGPELPTPSFLEAQTTGSINSTGVYNYTVSAGIAGCATPNSETVQFTVESESTAPTGIDNLQNFICNGGSTELEVDGGALGDNAQWEWFIGSCGTNPVGTGAIVSVNPPGDTTYYVRASAGDFCPPSACASIAVSLPPSLDVIAQNADSAFCYVNSNNWIHFRDQSGRLIASVNSNGQNLGEVMATVVVNPNGAYTVPSCLEPSNASFFNAALGRSFVLIPQFQPSDPVNVRLYISNAEVDDYIDAAIATSSNTFDDISGIGQLDLTKVSGGNNDGNPLNNCASGVHEYIVQGASGDINSLLDFSGYNSSSYLEYVVDGFSQFFPMHSNSSALPVSLNEFSAVCDGENTRITWSTASELNASHYILQSSRDGMTWLHLTEINAVGTTNQTSHYSFEDKNFGGLNYYRLVQVDFDGAHEIFGPISSNCEINNNLMTVHPNPSSDNFMVVIQTNQHIENAVVELMDLSGRVILSQTKNINAGSTMLNIDVQSIQPGAYVIRMKGENDKFAPIRVVKL